MFDFENQDEEIRREEWYAPVGEFMVLFSNLEFSTNEWIDLFCDSKVMSNHIKDIWSFQKRSELIIELIEEYDCTDAIKNRWRVIWGKTKYFAEMRNTIAHNPPFNNFKFDVEKGEFWKLKNHRTSEEICRLNKFLVEPGSGITMKKITEANEDLRNVLVELDNEHTNVILQYDQV